jgi:hypothetical protein
MMPPSQLDFDRFASILKSLGGGIRQEPCRPGTLPGIPAGTEVRHPDTAKVAVDEEQGMELRTRLEVVPAYTTGCGGQCVGVVPYDGEQPDGKTRFATICAICDACTMMPRFQGSLA